MTCPTCGFIMTDFDVECPRCAAARAEEERLEAERCTREANTVAWVQSQTGLDAEAARAALQAWNWDAQAVVRAHAAEARRARVREPRTVVLPIGWLIALAAALACVVITAVAVAMSVHRTTAGPTIASQSQELEELRRSLEVSGTIDSTMDYRRWSETAVLAGHITNTHPRLTARRIEIWWVDDRSPDHREFLAEVANLRPGETRPFTGGAESSGIGNLWLRGGGYELEVR